MGKYREFWTSGSNANLYTFSCHSGVKACIFAFENYKSYRIPHPLLVPSNEMPKYIDIYLYTAPSKYLPYRRTRGHCNVLTHVFYLSRMICF
jgi:hypothetical protein